MLIQKLISFFNLYELLPAFIGANNIGSQVNSVFKVKTFNHFPSFASSSLPSSAAMGGGGGGGGYIS